MIQSNYPVHARVDFSSDTMPFPGSDTDAFQAWLIRRDAARQQIRRLSRRELQVVDLVAQGLANKSIAQELTISVKTIEKHRANAARKLSVNSTADLVRISVLADHPQHVVLNRLRPENPVGLNPDPVHCGQ